jgi:hypothetical protein
MLHPGAGCTNNHDTDSQASEVLLELNTLVEAAPALLLNGPTPVAGELAGELPRKRLV